MDISHVDMIWPFLPKRLISLQRIWRIDCWLTFSSITFFCCCSGNSDVYSLMTLRVLNVVMFYKCFKTSLLKCFHYFWTMFSSYKLNAFLVFTSMRPIIKFHNGRWLLDVILIRRLESLKTLPQVELSFVSKIG